MAQIDFSNARIDCINPNFVFNSNLAQHRSYLMLGDLNFVTGSGSDSSGLSTVNNGKNIIANVTTKGFSVIKSGTVAASGDRIILRSNYGSTNVWRVSNISFDTGDTFDFQINVRIN